MLLKNGKELNLKKDERYKAFLEKVNQIGFPLKIVISNRYLTTKMWRASDNSVAAPKKNAKPKYFRFQVEENIAGENIKWAYAPTRPRKVDGEYILDHGEWYTRKVYNISEDRVDLAFFLLEIYERITKKKMFILDDPKLRARELASERKKLAGLDFYVYDENSPLLIGNKLEIVAKSLAIVDVDDMSKEEVQNAIWDSIKYGNSITYDEFIERLDLRYITVVRSQIQEGLDKKVIDYNEKLRTWIWLDDDYNPDGNICQANTSDKKKRVDSLLNFLVANSDAKNRLDLSLGGIGESFDAKRIDDYTFDQKKAFAKKVPGLKPVGMPKEDLNKALIDFYA